MFHDLAVADQLLKRLLAFAFPLQSVIFPNQTAALQRFLKADHQRVMIKGFGDEIIGTVAHGFNGGFNPAECRHHDDGQVRVVPFDQLQKLQTVHFGHFNVGQHQIEGLLRQELKAFFPGLGSLNPAFHIGLQAAFQQLKHIAFIIDDKNGFLHASSLDVVRSAVTKW